MKTILLLRHADIDPPPGAAPDDWPLNAAGQARADALARVVSLAGIGAVFVSPALRTQQTATPAAAQAGLPLRQTPASPAQFAQDILAEPAAVVLVVGHSNTVPALVAALGAAFSGPPLQDHDDLFVVTAAGQGSAQAVRLKYGAAGQ